MYDIRRSRSQIVCTGALPVAALLAIAGCTDSGTTKSASDGTDPQASAAGGSGATSASGQHLVPSDFTEREDVATVPVTAVHPPRWQRYNEELRHMPPEFIREDLQAYMTVTGGVVGSPELAVQRLQSFDDVAPSRSVEWLLHSGWPAAIDRRPSVDKKGNPLLELVGVVAYGDQLVRTEVKFHERDADPLMGEALDLFMALELTPGPAAWSEAQLERLRDHAEPQAGQPTQWVEVDPFPGDAAIPSAPAPVAPTPWQPDLPSPEGAQSASAQEGYGGGSPGRFLTVNNSAVTDSEIELAASQDGKYVVQVNNGTQIQVSSDYGITYTTAVADPANAFGPQRGDPSVSMGASGNAYFAYIGQNGTAQACSTAIAVATPTQLDGQCFAAGPAGAALGDCDVASCPGADCGCNGFPAGTVCLPNFSRTNSANNGNGLFADQEHIAADPVNTAATGGGDMVYAVWRGFTGPGQCPQGAGPAFGLQAQIACSHDGGTTWSAAFPVDTGQATNVDFPRVTVASDGIAWVVYESVDPIGAGNLSTVYVRPFQQCNNAATWGGPADLDGNTVADPGIQVATNINFAGGRTAGLNGVANGGNWPQQGSGQCIVTATGVPVAPQVQCIVNGPATCAAGQVCGAINANLGLINEIPGLDRTSGRGSFKSPMIAADNTNPNQLVVTYASTTAAPVPARVPPAGQNDGTCATGGAACNTYTCPGAGCACAVGACNRTVPGSTARGNENIVVHVNTNVRATPNTWTAAQVVNTNGECASAGVPLVPRVDCDTAACPGAGCACAVGDTCQALNSRRFMPWVCMDNGQGFVSWYDQRAATFTGAAPQNDLTDYYGRGFTITGTGTITQGTEIRFSTVSDSTCAAGWPAASGGGDAAEVCSAQPQQAGFCVGNPATRCDFSDCQPNAAGTGYLGPCNCPLVAGNADACSQARGAPKYGDYNGNACVNGRFYASWATGGIAATIDAQLGCPPDPGIANSTYNLDNTDPVLNDNDPFDPLSFDVCGAASTGQVTLDIPGAHDICGNGTPNVTGEVIDVNGIVLAPPVTIPATGVVDLPPGIHTIEWTATDAAGRTDSDTQVVEIRPLEDSTTCCNGLPLLTGTPGPDLLIDPDGSSWCIIGDDGQDEIIGAGPGADILIGGGNQDNVNGLAFGDVIYGSGGEDAITSVGGTIFAGDGFDAVDLNGTGTADLGNGSDAFLGTLGDHTIIPGDGIDAVTAGPGNDTVIINDLCEIRPTELLDGGLGFDTIQGPLPCATGDIACAEAFLTGIGVVAIGFEAFTFDDTRMHLATCLCQREICGDGADNDCDGGIDEVGAPEDEICFDFADNNCDGFVDEFPTCPSCVEETATVQQHVDAGRAFPQTVTSFFSTTTEYFVTGTSEPLGDDPDAVYTLAEIPAGSGLWTIGICDLCLDGEVCGDFLDNDCNGTIDDGCSCTPLPCLPGGCGLSVWNGCGDPTDPANQQDCLCNPPAVCSTATPGEIGICLGFCVPSGDELCDGIDNDCDPFTLDGADEPTLGNACDNPADTDMCTDGVMVCLNNSMQCDDDATSISEACDTVDNDCDLAVDEGPWPAETCGDGLDNDCDGTIDNGCPAPGCTEEQATLADHEAAGRAYTTTSTSFFSTITTWWAVGSNEELGTDANTVVTLSSSAAGVWDLGGCPTVCGDSVCEVGEDCNNCSADCGACPACNDYRSSLSDHEAAGRAYSDTTTSFFTTTTTWFAVGSDDVLGTDAGLVVDVHEPSPGFFEAGTCP